MADFHNFKLRVQRYKTSRVILKEASATAMESLSSGSQPAGARAKDPVRCGSATAVVQGMTCCNTRLVFCYVRTCNGAALLPPVHGVHSLSVCYGAPVNLATSES